MISRFAKSLIFVIFAMVVAQVFSRDLVPNFYYSYAQLLLATIALKHPPARMYIDPWSGQLFGEGGVEKTLKSEENWTPVIGGVKGEVIMGRLGNATAKAELGRATWKLLHTMTLRYPEHPTPDEREALSSYFYLSSRLYPCGECAAEFQLLLKKYPPQTSSRRAASLWLCFVHNEVNKRLKKPEFDCAHLSEKYDCGCGDDQKTDKSSAPDDLSEPTSRDLLTGANMIKGG